MEGLLTEFGLSGTTIAVVLLAMKIFLIIGKAIPDDATGWQATVRKVAKVLGGYIQNKAEAKKTSE